MPEFGSFWNWMGWMCLLMPSIAMAYFLADRIACAFQNARLFRMREKELEVELKRKEPPTGRRTTC